MGDAARAKRRRILALLLAGLASCGGSGGPSDDDLDHLARACNATVVPCEALPPTTPAEMACAQRGLGTLVRYYREFGDDEFSSDASDGRTSVADTLKSVASPRVSDPTCREMAARARRVLARDPAR